MERRGVQASAGLWERGIPACSRRSSVRGASAARSAHSCMHLNECARVVVQCAGRAERACFSVFSVLWIRQQRHHQHPAHPFPGLAPAAPGPHGLAAVRRAPHVIIASAMSACADRLPRAHAASSWFSSVFTSPTITVSALASTSSCAYSSEATTSIVATAPPALSFARATRCARPPSLTSVASAAGSCCTAFDTASRRCEHSAPDSNSSSQSSTCCCIPRPAALCACRRPRSQNSPPSLRPRLQTRDNSCLTPIARG